jgi:excisionase family DNA binding protein
MATITNQDLNGELLTIREVSQSLKVPVSWVYERTRRRGIERMPHIKLGKYLRFEPEAVRNWLKTMREN